MKKAKVVERIGDQTPNGRERILEVRGGEKGTGGLIGTSVVYWPWSPRSEEEADRIISSIVRSNNLDISEG